MKYIVFNLDEEILRHGNCQAGMFERQAHGENEFVVEGEADDAVDKIEIEEFDDKGKPIKVRIKKKTPEEIEAERPPEIPEAEKQAHITKGQYEDLLKRIAELEKQ